jgi:hypothetical protein
MIDRPAESEYASFYAGYVALVPETDILGVLEQQKEELSRLARLLGPDKETYRYEADKWSVREVLGHMIDGERVFGHRAFCISRGEQAGLPSFDQNQYVTADSADAIPLRELAEEFAVVRRSNLLFLRRLAPAEWTRVGTASGKPVSVRALAWVMAGHPRHHLAVLRERYGIA